MFCSAAIDGRPSIEINGIAIFMSNHLEWVPAIMYNEQVHAYRDNNKVAAFDTYSVGCL